MNTRKRPSIFFAVLDMGLGHATRTLPVIRHLITKNWEISVGSSGRSLRFLQREVPNLRWIELPNYGLSYTQKGVRISRLFGSLPDVYQAILMEHHITEQLVSDHHIDMIVSDHRYGCYSRKVPSFFLTHQVRFHTPGWLRPAQLLGFWFNRYFHKKYTSVLIPDEPGENQGLLSGKLSRIPPTSSCQFCGILSSIRYERAKEDIDLFISISGPEPQRTVLEEKIRPQVMGLSGKIIMALGKPESEVVETPKDSLRIHHHLVRSKMQYFYNRTKLIVCRPGYSTLMELAELGKKALLVPTPGQTEQLYLAERMKKMGYFYSTKQTDLDLERDIPVARQFTGIPVQYRTSQSVEKIFRILNDRLHNERV